MDWRSWGKKFGVGFCQWIRSKLTIK